MADMLENTKFVKLTAVSHLGLAEAIRDHLRQNKVGAVIINDEEVQNEDPAKRRDIIATGDPFRIEVPEELLGQARDFLREFYERLKKQGGQ